MKKILFFISVSIFLCSSTEAQTLTSETLLQDRNGNGTIDILAYGDSITRGEGDFTSSKEKVFETDPVSGEASYPLRIEKYLGIPVENDGSPGESLTGPDTLKRFINSVISSNPDLVLIQEGSNDGRKFVTAGSFYRRMQAMINVARAYGATPVVGTITPTCLGHDFLRQFIDIYNAQIKTLAVVNKFDLADNYHSFANTCNIGNCDLINRPEGLHPNENGYDVLGEGFIATLLKINIFAPDGPTLLAQALNLPITSIYTVPDPVVPTP
ncbi:MAG: SGNH/GDSL hydrolase family protein [Proteobacteria bacterium]|nr:SGNH/GDSL hydrolase family protein [Pseudomonadota bacterium]